MFPYPFQSSGVPPTMPNFPPTLPVSSSSSRQGSPMGPIKTLTSNASSKPSSESRPSSVHPSEVRSVVKHSSINFMDLPTKPSSASEIQLDKADAKQRQESDLQILRRIKIDISSGHHASYSAIIKPLALKSVSVTVEEAERQHLAALGLSLPPSSLVSTSKSSAPAIDVKSTETLPPPCTDEGPKAIIGPSHLSASASASASVSTSIPTAPRSSLASRLSTNVLPSNPAGHSTLKDRESSAKHEHLAQGPNTSSVKINPSAAPPTQPRAHTEGIAGRRPKRQKVDLDSSKDGPNAMMLDYSGMYDEVPSTPATSGALDEVKASSSGPIPEIRIKSPKKEVATSSISTRTVKPNPAPLSNASSSETQSRTNSMNPTERPSNISSIKPVTTEPTSIKQSAVKEQSEQMDEEEAEIESFLMSGIEDPSLAVDDVEERIDLSKFVPASTKVPHASTLPTLSSTPSTGEPNSSKANLAEVEIDGRIQMSTFEPRKPISSVAQASTASSSTSTPIVPPTTSSWWNWRVPVLMSRASLSKSEPESAVPSLTTEAPSTSSTTTSQPLPTILPIADAKADNGKVEESEREKERLALRPERRKRESEQQHERVPDRSGLVNRRESKQALKEKERRDREREAREYKEARFRPAEKGKERTQGKGGDRYHPYDRPPNGTTSPTRSNPSYPRQFGAGSEPPIRPFDVSPERLSGEKFPYRYDTTDVSANMIPAKMHGRDVKTNARSVSLGKNDNYQAGKSQGTGTYRDHTPSHHHPGSFNSSPTYAHPHAHAPPPPHQSGTLSGSAHSSKFQPSGTHLPPPPPSINLSSTGFARYGPPGGPTDSSSWPDAGRHNTAGYTEHLPHRQQQQFLKQQQPHSQHHPSNSAYPVHPPSGPSSFHRPSPNSFGPPSNGGGMANSLSGSEPVSNESNSELLREMQALKTKLAMLEQQASGSGAGGHVNSVPLHIPPPLHSQPHSYTSHEQPYHHQQHYQQGDLSYRGPPPTIPQSSRVNYPPPRVFDEGRERGWSTAESIPPSSSEGGRGGRFPERSVPPTYQQQQQQ